MNIESALNHHVGTHAPQGQSLTWLPHIVQRHIHHVCDQLVHNSGVAPSQRRFAPVFGMDGEINFPKMKFQHIAVAIDCWFRARLLGRALFYVDGSRFQPLTVLH